MSSTNNISILIAILIVTLCTRSINATKSPAIKLSHSANDESDLSKLINDLFDKIQDAQVKENIPFELPIEWAENKGIYPSQVKMNFVGKPDKKILRDWFGIFDNNMFVTTWVMELLLEAAEVNSAFLHRIEERSLLDGLHAILNSKDKNINDQPGNGNVPVYIFWDQIRLNNTWVAWPDNLKHVVMYTDEMMIFLRGALKLLGLDHLWEEIKPQFEEMQSMFTSFHIPPDFDDSGCNLGLGSLLSRQKSKFPTAAKLWQTGNSQIVGLTDRITKYAYKPFSSNLNENSIDPRTYYFMHEFLYEAQKSGSPLSLISTWVMNIDEDKQNYGKQVGMPFNVNNVDLSVCSNVLHGVVHNLLFTSSEFSWFTEDLQNTLLNSTSLVTWAIDSGRILERPDLGLVYYPPIYDLYWFLSRTANTLNNLPSQKILEKFPVLKQIRDMITKTLQNNGTKQLLKMSQENEKWTYWDDFLGLGDKSWNGHSEKHADDRVFSTSVALNALYDIWTVKSNESGSVVMNGKCSIGWMSGTPVEVISAANKAAKWLQDNSMTGEYKLYNAFFSGSVKGFEQLPFFFPANRLELVNGTILPPNPDPSVISDKLIIAMSGVMPEEEYKNQLQQTHFGVPVPVTFSGFNTDAFPFWSSDQLTEATTLLALTKYLSLSHC